MCIRDRIEVIYHGIDKRFKPSDNVEIKEIKLKYNLPDSYVLYVGTLAHPQKNLVRLLRAFKKCFEKGIDTKLVLCGASGFQADMIYKEVEKLNLGNRIIALGYVPDEDLPAIYSGARIFVFPSLYEGFGNPVLEAMACGTPVITSNSSSLKEISNGAALLVNPYSDEELKNAMFRLWHDEDLRRELIHKGKIWVQNFSWRSSALKLLRVINMFDDSNK